MAYWTRWNRRESRVIRMVRPEGNNQRGRRRMTMETWFSRFLMVTREPTTAERVSHIIRIVEKSIKSLKSYTLSFYILYIYIGSLLYTTQSAHTHAYTFTNLRYYVTNPIYVYMYVPTYPLHYPSYLQKKIKNRLPSLSHTHTYTHTLTRTKKKKHRERPLYKILTYIILFRYIFYIGEIN